MDWKQTIISQLRERSRQERDVYAEIVKHCKFNKWIREKKSYCVLNIEDNRVIDNYSILLLRSTEQESVITSLRQEVTDLQKNSVKYEEFHC